MQPGIRTALTLANDETFTNDAVLRDIPGFTVKLGPNQKGKVRLWIMMYTGAAGGIKFLFNPIAGGPADYFQQVAIFTNDAAILVNNFVTNGPGVYGFPLPSISGGIKIMQIEMYLTGSAAGTTYQLQMAQNTADFQQTSVIRGSSIEFLQL